ncbi:MAG: trypsin-like peptidase domain-containing protein [Acutalibacteraceae bacterium]|nr:trypsin-like peptidase domain-containing protein [Acutalibacteraceae bacterium]
MDDYNIYNQRDDGFSGNGGNENSSQPVEHTYIYNPDTPPYYNKQPSVKKERKKNKNTVTILVCALLSLIIGVTGGAFAATYMIAKLPNESSQSQSQNNTDGNRTDVNITVDETVNSAIEAVAKKVTPSVVGIRTTAAVQSFFGGSTESTGEGSGVIYSKDGYIITNYHVIESATGRTNASIEVFFEEDNQNPVSATVVGYNIAYDLAVIKVDKNGLNAITFANVKNLAVGQYVAAIGAPGGLEFMGSVSYGIVSGLNRTLAASNASDKEVSLIQTDAAINPGNSGGALVNIQGELIGINSSKIVSESFEGMGFAIPADTVKEICDKIIAKEYNPDPYIGITFSNSWTEDRLELYGYPAGAVVNSVVNGGPAYAAGIKSGDIITEFNGVTIKNVDTFSEALSKCSPSDTVSVKIYRSGRYYSTAITISSNNAQ